MSVGPFTLICGYFRTVFHHRTIFELPTTRITQQSFDGVLEILTLQMSDIEHSFAKRSV